MKPKKRQKLCHHCEADVDLDVIVCPFCAADLRDEKPEQGRQGEKVSPPVREYAVRGLPEEKVMAEEVGEKSPWSAIVLCSLGAQLLVLALLMLFFGDNGMLLLKWNAKWWPLYLVGSVPLIALGIRSLKN